MSTVADLPASAQLLIDEDGAPEFDASFTTANAVENWYVPRADLTDFLKVVGGDVSGTGGATGGLVRYVPLEATYFPYLLANKVNAKLIGWDRDAQDFAGAKVRIGFTRYPWDTTGADAFLTISGQPSERTLQAATNAFQLDGGTARTPHNPGILLPSMDYSITIHRLAALDEAFYAANAKSVNADVYRGNARGTVLFRGLGFQRTTTLGGVTTYEANLGLSVSPIDWNMESFGDGTFGKLVYAGTSDYRYPYLDFTQLFPS